MAHMVYTKETEFGTFRSDEAGPPAQARKNCIINIAVFAAATVLSLVLFFSFLGMIEEPHVGIMVLLVAALICGILTYHRIKVLTEKLPEAWDEFCRQVREREAKEPVRLYRECVENGITTLDAAGVARMVLLAKQINFYATEEELIQLYQQGKEDVEEAEKAEASAARLEEERRKQETIRKILQKEKEEENGYRKCADLIGSDKRVKECLDKATHLELRMKEIDETIKTLDAGENALLSAATQKEMDWATHGGIASAIAGPAAGVAVAMDIQQKNAEIRANNAVNKQFAQSIVCHSIEQKANLREQKEMYENKAQEWKKLAADAKLKLIEEKDQNELLELLAPVIKKTSRTETGSMVIVVQVKRAKLKIFETVNARIDGSFKVKIKDGENTVAEAYLVLPYLGSSSDANIRSICTSLPKDTKDYTFEFEPYHLCAMEN